VQQRACYSVLDSQHADGCRVLLDRLKHLLEGGATYQLYLLILEKQMCCNVVKRPYQSLYRYSFHISLFTFDVSHRTCSRSALLMQASLCSRLIAAFT
jgi:hypothetical protein